MPVPGAQGFEDLQVYIAARELQKRVYKLIRILPAEEKYALGPQMRRAAISLTNNIAEGYGRFSYPDMIRFSRIARGSLLELTDDMNICIGQAYAKPEHLQDLKNDAARVLQLLNGYIRFLRKRHNHKSGKKTDGE